jgi:F-type H+-transporting ATPase subunit a
LALLVAALVTLASLPAAQRLFAEDPPAGGHGGPAHGEPARGEAAHGEPAHGEAAPGEPAHGEAAPGEPEHGGQAHGAGHGGGHGGHPPELPNLITILHDRYVVQAEAENRPPAAWAQFLHRWENQLFMLFYIVLLVVVAAVGTRVLAQHPGPLQNGVEFVVEKLDDFVQGILGHRGRTLVPFLGTLFVFILVMNYAGLVPFLKSPTASINTTLSMAICVFLYVQWTGIRSFGLLGYLDHLAGSPRDLVGIILVPLMMPLHVVGELVKPLSLSLRLFGNVTGEDVLLAVFVGLGVGLLGAVVHGAPFGLPLQAIVYPLLLIFGFIQALVFTLLSTIYFYMMLPHDEHH